MDVLVLIAKLDDLVHNAKAVPLTDQVRIDREEIYDILDQMRATIPEEIKQARWIVKERQEMLAEAKRETDRLLGEAREQAVREASQTEIVKIAERQAQDIVDDARRQARETRLEMEDWADSILSTLEVNLEKILTAVKRGRERLHERSQETVLAGATAAPSNNDDQPFGPGEPPRDRRRRNRRRWRGRPATALSSRLAPAPSTTHWSGASATSTGRPVSALSRRSIPRRRAPPPATTIPRLATSAASSGGVASSVRRTVSTIVSSGCGIALRTSSESSVVRRSSPVMRSRPATSVSIFSGSVHAEPAASLAASPVSGPIKRFVVASTYRTMASSSS